MLANGHTAQIPYRRDDKRRERETIRNQGLVGTPEAPKSARIGPPFAGPTRFIPFPG